MVTNLSTRLMKKIRKPNCESDNRRVFRRMKITEIVLPLRGFRSARKRLYAEGKQNRKREEDININASWGVFPRKCTNAIRKRGKVHEMCSVRAPGDGEAMQFQPASIELNIYFFFQWMNNLKLSGMRIGILLRI